MSLQYTRPERIRLKNHPDFDERWLQDKVADDPSILVLGDLLLVQRERQQERAGRLDLLFSDVDASQRFEVELMLGSTDESHIIRAIEYWDIERRRYPGYDHFAVLVAEDITSRFLNVLSLFAGNIPLVAIQLNALKVGDKIVLDFVTVVDQRSLRRDDEAEEVAVAADRAYWEERKGKAPLHVIDDFLRLINQKTETPHQLNYNRGYIGLSDGHRSRNFIYFRPRKNHARVSFKVSDAPTWAERLEEAGLSADTTKRGRLAVNVASQDLEQCNDLLLDIIGHAVEEYQQ